MPAKPGVGDSAFDQFLAAERAQESSGHYGDVNRGSGALGAYQVMPYHIPDWSKAALGHSISVHEFLTHPEEQDAIARYEFKPIYDAHGPRGAAAWWYSGSWKLANDTRSQNGGPSIADYVNQVMAKIGKAGSVTGGTGGSSATPADDVSGSAVHTAGLQQAGYDAQIKLSDFGIPINPFKLPGWLDGALSGGVEAYGGEAGKALGGAVGGLAGGMWDAVGPLILSGIGVAAGAGIVLLGLYVTAKPAINKTTEVVQQTAQTAATVAPLAA
jgi:hypothetical protein